MEGDSVEKASPQLEVVDEHAQQSRLTGLSEENCCVLDVLAKRSFGALTFQAKAEIISKSRPTPDLALSTKLKNYNRHFKKDYFESVKWLTGCKSRNKLFCWPCVLFEKEKGVWNTHGFSDMSNFHKATIRHEKTQGYYQAITKLKTFGKTRIDFHLSEQCRSSTLKHNAEVDNNREIMKRFIDVTCLLARQELSFRGHNEHQESLNQGNYVEVLKLISKYDAKLEAHLQNAKVFKGTSNRIQNDLIKCIADVMWDKIKKEMDSASFFSIMLDETTDVAKKSQLSTIVRYVRNGEIKERFIGFQDVSDNRTSSALSEVVFEILSNYKCEKKLVAQSYDGAAVFAGHLNGLQSIVKEKFPSALFVYCYAHRLNLVLSQSVNFIKECKVFFKMLGGLPSFFAHSSKRVHALQESDVKKRFPSVAATRWSYNSRIVNIVYENRLELIAFFQYVSTDADKWDASTIASATGYLSFLNTFNFTFLLEVFMKIFSLTDTLFNVLQNKSLDIQFCCEKVKETISILKGFRNEFDDMYQSVIELNGPPEKRCRRDDCMDPKIKYLGVFNEVIDTVVGQMESRFQDLKELQFLELLNSKKYQAFKAKFPEDSFNYLKKNYGDIFCYEKLRSELVAVYRLVDFSGKTIVETMNFLRETDLADEAYPETYKLCCLASTIPVSTASAERSFSALKRINTYVRNSQGEERLSRLSLLSIEKSLLQELQQEKDFYNTVIEKFIAIGERKIDLIYK